MTNLRGIIFQSTQCGHRSSQFTIMGISFQAVELWEDLYLNVQLWSSIIINSCASLGIFGRLDGYHRFRVEGRIF